MYRIHSLEPIVDENSLILILGTIPGCCSLLHKEYYVEPRNKFWEIRGHNTNSIREHGCFIILTLFSPFKINDCEFAKGD